MPIGGGAEAQAYGRGEQGEGRSESANRAKHEKRSEGAGRSPVPARDNKGAREGGQSLPLLLSQSVTIREELLEVRKKGLERRCREPPGELLEYEGEAGGGEAELLGSIEEKRAMIGGENHQRGEEERSAEQSESGSSIASGRP